MNKLRALLAIVISLVVVQCVYAAPSWFVLAQAEAGAEESITADGGVVYLSAIKLILFVVLYLAWVGTVDWANTACWRHDFPFKWNMILFLPFVVGIVLFLAIPLFLVGYPLLLLTWLVPFVAFVIFHNQRVDSDEKVFTQRHFRRVVARMVKPLGMEVEPEPVDPRDAGPPITLYGRGGVTPRVDAANLLAARQAPGYNDLRMLLFEAIERRAEAMVLDFRREAVARQVLVDGVWISMPAVDRETADFALEALKILCGLNPEDRRSRQRGLFGLKFNNEPIDAVMVSQGTNVGERVVVQFQRKKTEFKTLDELGMRPEIRDRLKEVLAGTRGFVLLSAPPGQGLRTTASVVLQSMDRYVRDFISVEDEQRRYEEVENVAVMTYDSAKGQKPTSILRDVFLKEPGVVVCRDLVDAETVLRLLEEIPNDRFIIGAVRANDCVDAVLKLIELGVPHQELAKHLTAVTCQRLVRKLCEHCKEAYVPPPQLLKQLRLPAQKVQLLFRPPHPEEDKICEVCRGIGYYGRTAVFETLFVNDTFRQVLASNPQPTALRQAARKAGTLTLQEEAVLLVAKGITSVAEIARVFKNK